MASKFDLCCFKPTSDWWCGNHYEKLVEISLVMISPDGTYWRVGVWGNDDMGMIKDFNDDYPAALELYHTLLRTKNITIDLCIELGFESF